MYQAFSQIFPRAVLRIGQWLWLADRNTFFVYIPSHDGNKIDIDQESWRAYMLLPGRFFAYNEANCRGFVSNPLASSYTAGVGEYATMNLSLSF
jgi:hypothetical protein